MSRFALAADRMRSARLQDAVASTGRAGTAQCITSAFAVPALPEHPA